MREINSIQYLRGLAAISVLVFHVTEGFEGTKFKIGSAGVDVFFVISGFIMWVTTADRGWTPQNFMLRRVIRIVPLYWIVTCVTAIAILTKPQFMYGSDLSVLNFLASLLFMPDIRNGEFYPVVIQGWTLGYEMFFYLVFAVALIAPRNLRIWLVAASLGLLVLLRPLITNDELRALANPIIIEFVFGMALAIFWLSRWSAPPWMALVLLVTGLLLFVTVDDFVPNWARLTRWGVPAVMVVAGTVLAERARRIPVVYPLRLLGDASYSIYLWHMVAGAVLNRLLLKIKLPLAFHLVSLGVLTLSATIMLYFLIEKPVVALLRPKTYRPLASA